MERDAFKIVTGLSVVDEILLDLRNPRTGESHDQVECFERILKHKKQFLNLMEDIAKEGLSIEPIVVRQVDKGKYVVRDGNRRVAAMKLLNDPTALPSKFNHIASKINQISTEYSNYPQNIDCYVCNDE